MTTSITCPLDPTFEPASIFHRNYRAAVAASRKGGRLVLGLERDHGLISRYETTIHPDADPTTARFVERMVKFLLWARGGWKLYIGGPKAIGDLIRKAYSPRGARKFDCEMMTRIYGKRFEEERKHVADLRKKSPVITAEVQGLRIGPLGIATNGAEYFCEYGLRIKKASRHPFTWVSTLSNDYIGYVPTPQAFAGGGYEPRTARSSMLAPDAGQRLLEGALKALNRLLPKADEKKDEKK